MAAFRGPTGMLFSIAVKDGRFFASEVVKKDEMDVIYIRREKDECMKKNI